MIQKPNPIVSARESAGLSSGEFAVALGVDTAVVSQHERGHRAAVSENMVRGLNRLGFDGEKIAKEYQEWRRDWADQIVSTKLAAGE